MKYICEHVHLIFIDSLFIKIDVIHYLENERLHEK